MSYFAPPPQTYSWRAELGNHSWFLIHSLVYNILDAGTLQKYKQFIESLLDLYPCEVCASHMKTLKTRAYLRDIEWPKGRCDGDQTAMLAVEKWAWTFHNEVNKKLGKAAFPFDRVCQKYKHAGENECSIEL